MAIKKIKSIHKRMFYKYKMIAEECCYTRIKLSDGAKIDIQGGYLKETEFHFANKENADFFSNMLKSLIVFKNKI